MATTPTNEDPLGKMQGGVAILLNRHLHCLAVLVRFGEGGIVEGSPSVAEREMLTMLAVVMRHFAT